jgi:ribosomal-protein-alanine N-acetyltransferase
MIFIESKRITLCALNPEEIKEAYSGWINSQKTDVYTQHALFPHFPDRLMDYYQERTRSKNSVWLAIKVKDDGQHIGNIDISNIDWVNRSGIYNVLIGSDAHHGKGYAFEASILILRHVFNRLNLNRIQLGVRSDNLAAIKLYEKLGFVKEGLLRKTILDNGQYLDTLVMGLLRDEFNAKNGSISL